MPKTYTFVEKGLQKLIGYRLDDSPDKKEFQEVLRWYLVIEDDNGNKKYLLDRVEVGRKLTKSEADRFYTPTEQQTMLTKK